MTVFFAYVAPFVVLPSPAKPPLWIVTFLAYFAVLGAQGRNSDDSFELATELQSALEISDGTLAVA